MLIETNEETPELNSNEKEVEKLQKEISKLKQELMEKEVMMIEQKKFKILEEENVLLNKKLACYINENNLLKKQLKILTDKTAPATTRTHQTEVPQDNSRLKSSLKELDTMLSSLETTLKERIEKDD